MWGMTFEKSLRMFMPRERGYPQAPLPPAVTAARKVVDHVLDEMSCEDLLALAKRIREPGQQALMSGFESVQNKTAT
jgi:hypothetical protein